MAYSKHKLLKICALLLFHVASCTDCLHLVPSSYSCCDDAGSLPHSGSGLISVPSSDSDLFGSGGLKKPSPAVAEDDTSAGYRTKAYSCSLIPCLEEETASAVCACNFNTGNVVTFKNSCDVKKHNCRFDTAFKVILNEICPWEFESRRSNKPLEFNYNNPKYYN